MGTPPRRPRRRWVLGLLHRAWQSLVEGLSVPGLGGAPLLRLAKVAYRVRLIVAASSLGGVWLLPHASERERVTFLLLIALVYVPYAMAVMVAAKRTDSPLLRAVTMTGDMVIVFLFQTLIPQTQIIALLSYLLILAFYALLGGPAAGSAVAVTAMAFTVVAELLASSQDQLGSYTLSTYASTLAFMVLLAHQAGKEQRQAAARLDRLYQSLRTVSSRWQLDDVLSVVTDAVRATVGARLVGVWVHQSDALHTSAAVDVDRQMGRELALAVCHAGHGNDRHLSPRRPHVVANLASEPRLKVFAPMAHSLGLGPAMLVPLCAEGATMGVLVAFKPSGSPSTEDQLDYLAAYAEQASVAVWRWQMEEALRSSEVLLADAAMRQKHALELNDDIVQGLTVAKYALDLGDSRVAGRAVEHTLRAARAIVNDLLRDVDGKGLAPGDLVRARPAQVDAVEAPEGCTTMPLPPATMES